MLGIVLVSLGFALPGLLLGRWWVVVLPLVGWPLFFLGLHRAWWGSGVGDAWELALGLLTGFGAAAAAGGVLLRRRGPWTSGKSRGV